MSRRVARAVVPGAARWLTASAAAAVAFAAPPGARAQSQPGPAQPGQAQSGQAQPGARTAGAPRAGARSGAAPCRVEGVWDLVSVAVNGKDQPLRGRRERKFVDRGHFMWISEDARPNVVAVRNSADSSRNNRITGGAGTYSLAGSTYTEHLELFFDPRRERQSLPATCRTEPNRWYHTYSWPDDPATASGRPPQTTEVWRRIR